MSKSDFVTQCNFDSISTEEIEKQKEISKKSAMTTAKAMEEAKEKNPNEDTKVLFAIATGCPKDYVEKARKVAKIEKLQGELKKLDSEKDKNRIKEIEKDLKNIAKEAGEPEDKYLHPNEESKKSDSNDKFKDDEGNEYRKDGDKYFMKDSKGEEKEINKEKFDASQKEAVNDDETEEETKNSKFDNGEPEENEADDNEKKSKQDPRKVWKKKSYKRGDKTFMTKSYYNRKGDSISAADFKEKLHSFMKNQKTNESINLSNYMKLIFDNRRFF